MIYSYRRRWCFIHAPRTGGTRLTEALQSLAPEAVADVLWLKHASRAELPEPARRLRCFTLTRPIDTVRRSFYRQTVDWYLSRRPETVATVQWHEYAARVAGLTWEEFDRSDLFPRSLDRWTEGLDAVFRYEDRPWPEIAAFCRVDPGRLAGLMQAT